MLILEVESVTPHCLTISLYVHDTIGVVVHRDVDMGREEPRLASRDRNRLHEIDSNVRLRELYETVNSELMILVNIV